MPSLSPKDRMSLCQFTFADGRRCRTPRAHNHPHFCFDHAQKESRANATESLGKDLAYFFSGDYLSACDLATALGRLLPAVVCGDVKPRTARTVAYLAQTLLQTIHLAKHEYINTFGTDGWRDSIRNSVNGNYNHRFPPAPEPEQPESPQPQPQSAPPSPPPQPAPAQQPAPSPHTPMPPTGAEFAQQLLAGLPVLSVPVPPGETGGSKTPQPASAPTPAPQSPPSPHLTLTHHLLRQPNPLRRLCQPLRPLALNKVKRSTPHLRPEPTSQTVTPPGGTPATFTIPQIAISFRCNTYKPC